MSKYGECGWLAERELFGGRFFIYWDDKEDEGNMAAISHVVLDDSDSEWEIGESSQWCLLYGADIF